jgi:hypothetical protein
MIAGMTDGTAAQIADELERAGYVCLTVSTARPATSLRPYRPLEVATFQRRPRWSW